MLRSNISKMKTKNNCGGTRNFLDSNTECTKHALKLQPCG